MLNFGALGFAAPLALVALASLPILYLLLRATPPPPRRTPFPPFRLLMDTKQDEETPKRTPLWLVILRLLIAALVIFGLARPILFPRDDGPSRPLLLVVDDDWGAAANWPRIADEARAWIDMAERAGEPVALAFTAPRLEAADIAARTPAEARRALAAHQPAAWGADRALLAERIGAADLPPGMEAVWLANGIGGEGVQDLFAELRDRSGGSVRALVPGALTAPLALRPPTPTARGFEAQIVRAETGGARGGEIAALSADGRLVARAGFTFSEGGDIATVEVPLPPELRRRAALVRVTASPSAGAAAALGDAWRRPSVGIVEEGAADAQPLLSDLYYLERALAPFSEPRRGRLAEFLDQAPGVIALVDGAGGAGATSDALVQYVRDGGVLLRFAGPLLSAGRDSVLPVRLREGGRDFGGALAWGEPQRLAPFGETSPFADLAISEEVTVSRQVLAEPSAELTQRTWARLRDGTPLVTAMREGQGWIVLFHVTAGPEWSSLPLSGLFPEMLQRVTAYAEGGAGPAAEAGAAWSPDRVLTADGMLAAPPAEAESIPAAQWASVRPGPQHPPGLYRRGAALEGLNIASADFVMERFPRTGAAVDEFGAHTPRALAGLLLLFAMLLLAADALIALILSGRLRPLLRRLRLRAGSGASGAAAAGLALALFAAAAPDSAQAQETAPLTAPPGVNELRLAYVRTGDRSVDDMSHAGLLGLSAELIRRTSVEPDNPVGLDLERDALIFYPLIYWPIVSGAQPLSEEAAARLDAYVRAGGTVLIDTRDAGSRILEGEAGAAMQRALQGVDVPPLQPTPADHVLTKAFFLMDRFPGRWADGRVWVEIESASGSRDGVSGWIVGGNDWASAWAVDNQGRALAAVSGGDADQREWAYRFGINLVMYVLTGNYKSDQVHIPDLLERLGQ